MPSGTLMTAETTHLNPRRSKSSVPVQLNLPVDLAQQLRALGRSRGGTL